MSSNTSKTILLLSANPKGTTQLRLDQEVREIDAGLQRARNRDQFVLEQKWAVRPRDIQRAMLDSKPSIVHFSEHGTGNEGLVFEDEIGGTKLVDGEALAGLFKLFANDVECVVLNGCYSEVQATAIARHVNYVIGMSKQIGDQAAIEFAVGFYDALGAGRPVEFAHKFGCAAIRLAGIPEDLTPVLKKKPGIDETIVKISSPSDKPASTEETTSVPSTVPIEVFFSYSYQDEQLRDKLVKHLDILKQQGIITAWHDREISAGTEWAGEIDAHLNTANVILLLISADFLASDYCYDIELTRAMERHVARKARVIPVILHEIDWKSAPFGKLQALPENARPVTSWENRDQAFADVARGIGKVVEELKKQVNSLLFAGTIPVTKKQQNHLAERIKVIKTTTKYKTLVPETIINNRYKIQGELGNGDFGRTYLASDDQRFGELCVLKEFVPKSSEKYKDKKSREFFEREAKVLFQMNHQQIPKFLAWFTEKERVFIVQQYINGQTYAQLLKQGRLFSEAEVIQWLKDLLEVLDYIHQRNIIHRDISPDNIMLPNDQSKPILIDFGLVKQKVTEVWEETYSSISGLPENYVAGKRFYAAPEQIQRGECYPSSDLYALAKTTRELLSGKNSGVLIDSISIEWQWPAHVKISVWLDRLLEKMLEEKPWNRYKSAQEVLAALRYFLEPGQIDLSIKIDQDKRNREVNETIKTFNFKEAEVPKPLKITPAFIEICRQELARHVGPMARYILQEKLDKHPNIHSIELIEELATEIHNPQRAEEFRNNVKIDPKT